MNKTNTVTLSINIFERTKDKIFKKGFFKNIEKKFNYKFDDIHVIINNVDNRGLIEKKVQNLKEKGIITDFYFVEDYIDKALISFGIDYDVLGKIPHYSDFLYVSIFVTKTKFLFHFDSDNVILKSGNFVNDSVILLNSNKSVMCTAPKYLKFYPEQNAITENDNFYFCYLFGDQIFFIRKEDFSKNIYNYKCMYPFVAYPLSHVFPIFEQRVNSYMRCNNRFLAYHKSSSYSQPNVGNFYSDNDIIKKYKLIYKYLLISVLELLKLKNPKYRVYGNLDYYTRINLLKRDFGFVLKKIYK